MADFLQIELQGDKDMEAALKKAAIRIKMGVVKGTHEWSKRVMAISQARAPIATGALRVSAFAFMNYHSGLGTMGFMTTYAPFVWRQGFYQDVMSNSNHLKTLIKDQIYNPHTIQSHIPDVPNISAILARRSDALQGII